ncbi:hypothetical protein VE04_08880 [Pseudogymnoascus sp. 24MN13]|nr:hypothetical protein VE04_08880 [Pseudogymnoascus sp. 24MN13]
MELLLGPNQPHQQFPILKLPLELRRIVWHMALDNREGRIILSILECVGGPDAQQTGFGELEQVPTSPVDPNGPEVPYAWLDDPGDLEPWLVDPDDIDGLYLRPIDPDHSNEIDLWLYVPDFPQNYCPTDCRKRPPVPALLHACRESRALAKEVYTDVGQGGLFDSARDTLLVLASGFNVEYTYKTHHNLICSTIPSPDHNYLRKWLHIRHVLYYIRNIRDHITYFSGGQLRTIFNPRAWGLPIDTITVLSEKVVAEDDRVSFHRGWNTTWPNDDTTAKSPIQEMIWSNDCYSLLSEEPT